MNKQLIRGVLLIVLLISVLYGCSYGDRIESMAAEIVTIEDMYVLESEVRSEIKTRPIVIGKVSAMETYTEYVTTPEQYYLRFFSGQYEGEVEVSNKTFNELSVGDEIVVQESVHIDEDGTYVKSTFTFLSR